MRERTVRSDGVPPLGIGVILGTPATRHSQTIKGVAVVVAVVGGGSRRGRRVCSVADYADRASELRQRTTRQTPENDGQPSTASAAVRVRVRDFPARRYPENVTRFLSPSFDFQLPWLLSELSCVVFLANGLLYQEKQTAARRMEAIGAERIGYVEASGTNSCCFLRLHTFRSNSSSALPFFLTVNRLGGKLQSCSNRCPPANSWHFHRCLVRRLRSFYFSLSLAYL